MIGRPNAGAAVPGTVPASTLSKSDFKAARECAAKLYYRERRYPSAKDNDEYLALLAEGGYIVEQLAKLRYPQGVALAYGGDPRVAAAETLQRLSEHSTTLFEATLLSGRKLARADIIEKRGDEIRLVEVKAKSFDSTANRVRLSSGTPNLFRAERGAHSIVAKWRPYLEDVAYQAVLLEEMLPGVVVRPFLCLVDKSGNAKVDGLPGFFQVERRMDAAGRERIHTARFVGAPEQAEVLRGENLLVEVDVSQRSPISARRSRRRHRDSSLRWTPSHCGFTSRSAGRVATASTAWRIRACRMDFANAGALWRMSSPRF